MIAKNDLEFQLWADIFNVKSRLTPSEDSTEYFKKMVAETNEVFSKYEHTPLESLACGLLAVVREDLSRSRKT